eukprot:COSAG04_NODE_19099_length_425_cov_0.619632_1_plen_100_part_10
MARSVSGQSPLDDLPANYLSVVLLCLSTSLLLWLPRGLTLPDERLDASNLTVWVMPVGESAVLSAHDTRTRTVRAVTDCELCYITREAVRGVCDEYIELQ